MAISVYLPEIMETKIRALVKVGVYPDESGVVKDALIDLFENRADLRTATAVELYPEGEVSLSKAANLAGVTTVEFKDILAKKGVVREIESAPAEEIDKKLKNTFKKIEKTKIREMDGILKEFAGRADLILTENVIL